MTAYLIMRNDGPYEAPYIVGIEFVLHAANELFDKIWKEESPIHRLYMIEVPVGEMFYDALYKPIREQQE